jgi:membrane-bound lytic murein transglycosylase F
MKKMTVSFLMTFLVLTSLSLGLNARSWDDIVASKELRIATRVREGVMSKEGNSGFHFDLAKNFAKNNGLELKVIVKSSLSDYFSGTIFQEVDLVVDNITANAERGEKMGFIDVLAIKQILVTAAGHVPLRRISDLGAETIVVAKDSSYYTDIQLREKENKLTFKYYYSSSTAEQLNDLLAGKGTVTILDSNLAGQLLTDSRFQLHGSVTPVQSIAWGYQKSQSKTSEKVSAYMAETKKNGLFGKTWDKYTEGITYEDYLKLVAR